MPCWESARPFCRFLPLFPGRYMPRRYRDLRRFCGARQKEQGLGTTQHRPGGMKDNPTEQNFPLSLFCGWSERTRSIQVVSAYVYREKTECARRVRPVGTPPRRSCVWIRTMDISMVTGRV